MTTAVRPSARADIAMLGHQVRYEQLSFWRNPQSALFTFAFPVVLTVVFGTLFRGGEASPFFHGLEPLQYYVATIAAVSVLGACYSQLAIVLATRRQDGILKRVRATPLPTWMYFAGLLAHCVMVSTVDVTLIVGIGRLYGVGVPEPSLWPLVALIVLLGAAAFCAIGVAVASMIRNAEAAPPVVQLVLFPLVFISGTYLPIHSDLLNHVAAALPVQPLNHALLDALTGGDIRWSGLGVLAAWGVVGAAVAVRRFSWESGP
jgi:ABC-2 type transport system permease protein